MTEYLRPCKFKPGILLLFMLSFNILPVFSQTVQVFTTSGTFTVPACVTSITVMCWGAGGGGGANNGYGWGFQGSFGSGSGGSVVNFNTINAMPISGTSYLTGFGGSGGGVSQYGGMPGGYGISGGGGGCPNAASYTGGTGGAGERCAADEIRNRGWLLQGADKKLRSKKSAVDESQPGDPDGLS